MKIYIQSCHAVLEYDQARMFTMMGHEVVGLFDVGSTQRPKIPGITDIDPPGDVHERSTNCQTTLADLQGADVVVMHQTGDFPERAAMFAALGMPTVCMAFGQGNLPMHTRLTEHIKASPLLSVASYSLKDADTYADLGCPLESLAMIRFGKRLSEFGPWVGDIPVIYCTGNSIHERGDACGWEVLEPILNTMPIILSGIGTEEIGGLGEIDPAAQAILFKRCRAFLALGTVPAPYTLAPMEAACHGTPIIAWNNGHGIHGEGFPWQICDTTSELLNAMGEHLDKRQTLASIEIREHAKQHFAENVVAKTWQQVLNEGVRI